MNNILANLLASLKNAHLSVPIIGSVILELIPIYWPGVKAQCQETQKILLAYGLIAAANSGPNNQPTKV